MGQSAKKIKLMYWKDRLKAKWNIYRLLYLMLGLALAIQGAVDGPRVAIPFGLFFSYMGLMGLGCASGSCGIPNSKIEWTKNKKNG